jgi:hypothetical protein
MRRFLYFLQGAQGNPTADIICKGWPQLAYAFRGESSSCRGIAGGSLGAGLLVGVGDPAAWQDGSHTWREIPCEAGKPKAFVGVPNDPALFPGPADLLREKQSVDSRDVVLGDGNTWRVPVVRFLNGSTALPRVLMMDESGHVRFDLRREYRALVNMADKICDAEFRNAAQYSAGELLWFAAEALAVNYRVSALEVAALQLVDTSNLRAIAEAALDAASIRKLLDEFQKKTVAPCPVGRDSLTGAAG